MIKLIVYLPRGSLPFLILIVLSRADGSEIINEILGSIFSLGVRELRPKSRGVDDLESDEIRIESPEIKGEKGSELGGAEWIKRSGIDPMLDDITDGGLRSWWLLLSS